jgi:hypothetical protein
VDRRVTVHINSGNGEYSNVTVDVQSAEALIGPSSLELSIHTLVPYLQLDIL